MVLNGKLTPGAPIVERDLAKRLGLSRTPVREALAELGREGLIRTVGSRARVIAEPSIQDIVELYDLREMVEGMAARLLAARIADKLLAELEPLAQGLDSDRLTIADDFRFHELIVEHCGNGRLNRIASAVQIQWMTFKLGEALIRRGLISAGSNRRLRVSHRDIVAALASRDPDRAERVARDHILELKEHVLPHLT